jgi:signal peptidase I
MRAVLGTAASAAALVAALVVVRKRFVVVRVIGSSMEPTLHEGQRVVVRRITLDRVGPGQLVVFASLSHGPDGLPLPGDPPWMVKRAVALPGDPIPPDALAPSYVGVDARVPPGRLVVLGDNRTASFDSRRAGYVDGSTLLGVVQRVMT